MNKNIFYLIITLLIGACLYFLAPVLVPFVIAAILAYLVDPLVILLMRFRIPRLASVIIVFLTSTLVVILFFLLLIPMIENQISMLAVVIPNMVSWLQETILPNLKEYFGIQEVINIATLKKSITENWIKAGGAASWLWTSVLHSSFALMAWTVNLLLIPVVTFYLLRDWNKLLFNLRGLIPRKNEPVIIKLAKECDDVLSAFFRGQLLVMLSLGIIYSVGLTILGLQIGLMIGMLSGLLSIVPYLGFITGIAAASIAAMVQFGSFKAVLIVWGIYLLGQGIESMFLTPNLVGDRIGLHPVAVIFAILAGGTLFGFFGVLLALPVASVAMVLLRFLNKRYRKSKLYHE